MDVKQGRRFREEGKAMAREATGLVRGAAAQSPENHKCLCHCWKPAGRDHISHKVHGHREDEECTLCVEIPGKSLVVGRENYLHSS